MLQLIRVQPEELINMTREKKVIIHTGDKRLGRPGQIIFSKPLRQVANLVSIDCELELLNGYSLHSCYCNIWFFVFVRFKKIVLQLEIHETCMILCGVCTSYDWELNVQWHWLKYYKLTDYSCRWLKVFEV